VNVEDLRTVLVIVDFTYRNAVWTADWFVTRLHDEANMKQT